MFDKIAKNMYSRTSVARTLRLAWLFRTRSVVPRKKSLDFRFGIIEGNFLFYIEIRYVVCNDNTQHTFML